MQRRVFVSKNEELDTKVNNAKNIYAMCRLYQVKQEKGRELTLDEMLETRDMIVREISVYDDSIISE